MNANEKLDPATFRRLCEIAYDRAGIALKKGKEALVASRISKRIRALKLQNAKEYLRVLEGDTSGTELAEFLDVITTNFTSFNRENDHFLILRQAATRWRDQGQERFRFWSAASSSGEEPYSILVALGEVFSERVDYKLLGTDISQPVLATAREGIYEESKLKPLTPQQLKRFFREVNADKRGNRLYQVLPEVRSRAVFKRLNLSTPPFPMKGPLDFVFCRNVMIYFDLQVRQRLLSEIERLLKPGGFLCIGHAETLTGIRSTFTMLKPSVYVKGPRDLLNLRL